MGNPTLKPAEIHETVRRHLSEREIRYTTGRRAVVTTLVRLGGPESAAELHHRIGGVPLSSLYRSLTVLDEAGVLEKHHDVDGLARFELAEWITGHHHHVVCISCGMVEDVELGENSESSLDLLAGQLASATGYEVAGHNLEVEGVCPKCQT